MPKNPRGPMVGQWEGKPMAENPSGPRIGQEVAPLDDKPTNKTVDEVGMGKAQGETGRRQVGCEGGSPEKNISLSGNGVLEAARRCGKIGSALRGYRWARRPAPLLDKRVSES